MGSYFLRGLGGLDYLHVVLPEPPVRRLPLRPSLAALAAAAASGGRSPTGGRCGVGRAADHAGRAMETGRHRIRPGRFCGFDRDGGAPIFCPAATSPLVQGLVQPHLPRPVALPALRVVRTSARWRRCSAIRSSLSRRWTCLGSRRRGPARSFSMPPSAREPRLCVALHQIPSPKCHVGKLPESTGH